MASLADVAGPAILGCGGPLVNRFTVQKLRQREAAEVVPATWQMRSAGGRGNAGPSAC